MVRHHTLNHARLSDNFKYLIDDHGERIDFDDPRVVHVWPINTPLTMTRAIKALFNKRGWRFRFPGPTDIETLQYARRLCSGRECLPCTALTGDTYKDILHSREKNEISVYYNLNQEGPCQNGGWTIIWDTFRARLRHENVIFMAYPCITTNFMGQGDLFALDFAIAIALGDIFEEAEGSLTLLARNPAEAGHLFKRYTDHVIESIPRGLMSLKKALDRWISVMKQVPLKASLAEIPKILLFGGLNIIYIHHTISQFFQKQGIIAKVVDFSEGASWLTSEHVTRFGAERGLMEPPPQYRLLPLLFSMFNSQRDLKHRFNALRARVHLWGFDTLIHILRRYMGKSGLLYDLHTPFPRLARAGHRYASTNGFNETSITVGRYRTSVQDGRFDGLVNIGAFNCQPAMNAQAILRSLANTNDTPFVSIDCEGPFLSASQERLLETLAVQAKRHHQNRRKNLSCTRRST